MKKKILFHVKNPKNGEERVENAKIKTDNVTQEDVEAVVDSRFPRWKLVGWFEEGENAGS